MLNKTLIGIGVTLATLGIPAYYYLRSEYDRRNL